MVWGRRNHRPKSTKYQLPPPSFFFYHCFSFPSLSTVAFGHHHSHQSPPPSPPQFTSITTSQPPHVRRSHRKLLSLLCLFLLLPPSWRFLLLLPTGNASHLFLHQRHHTSPSPLTISSSSFVAITAPPLRASLSPSSHSLSSNNWHRRLLPQLHHWSTTRPTDLSFHAR